MYNSIDEIPEDVFLETLLNIDDDDPLFEDDDDDDDISESESDDEGLEI